MLYGENVFFFKKKRWSKGLDGFDCLFICSQHLSISLPMIHDKKVITIDIMSTWHLQHQCACHGGNHDSHRKKSGSTAVTVTTTDVHHRPVCSWEIQNKENERSEQRVRGERRVRAWEREGNYQEPKENQSKKKAYLLVSHTYWVVECLPWCTVKIQKETQQLSIFYTSSPTSQYSVDFSLTAHIFVYVFVGFWCELSWEDIFFWSTKLAYLFHLFIYSFIYLMMFSYRATLAVSASVHMHFTVFALVERRVVSHLSGVAEVWEKKKAEYEWMAQGRR